MLGRWARIARRSVRVARGAGGLFERVGHAAELLVFRRRMQQPLEPQLFAAISQEFHDILAPGGQFETGSALEGEFDEPDLAHLSRLFFAFNRRSLGRLRQQAGRRHARQ